MGSAGVPKPWEKLLPNLGNWTCASKRTRKYNCFAFAVGDETQRWEPYGYHWPKGAKKGYALDCLVEACRTEGFELCADGSLLEDREKIAIYTNDQSGFVHAARQEPDGRWKSKLGDEEDIVHETPESLSSDTYGRPRCFMERARKPKLEEKEAEATTPSASSEVEQSDRQVDVSNPNHLEDFNSLLNAAVRKPEPKD
jgi:hypothetical protein